jgi:hypothetical protein
MSKVRLLTEDELLVLDHSVELKLHREGVESYVALARWAAKIHARISKADRWAYVSPLNPAELQVLFSDLRALLAEIDAPETTR